MHSVNIKVVQVFNRICSMEVHKIVLVITHPYKVEHVRTYYTQTKHLPKMHHDMNEQGKIL